MLVDVFVSWVREINASSEAVQELIQYKDSPKARIRLDLRMLTEKEIDRLVKTANDDKGYGYRALATAVETFRALLEDANSQPIKDLRVLEAALIEHFRKTPNKWVFVVRNEHRVPYYVESVKHHSAERLSPAFVTLELQCGPCISDDGSEIIRWHAQDLSGKNKTVGQLLLAKNILTETELLVNVYHQEMESWRTHVLNVGEQYNAVGRATVLGGDSWSTDYIEMEHDGIPAKIVIDDGSETGYESRRDDRKRAGDNDQTTDASFWGVASNPKRKGKGKYEEDIADEEEFAVLPIPPFIPAFDLRRHQFVEIHVSDISPYEYDSKLRDKVVLPEGNLELMSILVESADEVMEDIVKGKTGGTIVIATGPPGCGKTLTAEMFSEEIKKPLYTIQCSQLGVDPKALEGQLGAVLNRAMRWKAILLIDEADVYVRARGDDIQQNAIVGIWLRVLEYYRGILFLTSNKDTMIDDAVMSRATAWVKYDYPDQDKLTQLWHVLSAQYAFELDGRHIRRLVDRWPRLSGRNIKNMLKLATQLRKVSKSDPLDLFERAACFLDLPKQPSNKDA